MKKTLLVCALSVATALGAFAQSTVTFANDGTSLIRQFGSTAGVPVGAYRVELLYAPAGTSDAEFDLAAIRLGADTGIAPVPGRFSGGGRTAPTTPGGSFRFQVRAWESAYASYDAQTLAGTGFYGKSGILNITGGNPTTTPAGTPTPITAAGFAGFNVIPVPEPSAIALGLVGAGALLLLRRRK